MENQSQEKGNFALENWKKKYATHFQSIRKYLSEEETDFSPIDAFIQSVKDYADDCARSNTKSEFKIFGEQNFEEQKLDSLIDALGKLAELISNEIIWKRVSNPDAKKNTFIETYNELRTYYLNRLEAQTCRMYTNQIMDEVRAIIQTRTGKRSLKDCNISDFIQKMALEEKIQSFLEKVVKPTDPEVEELFGYQIVVKLRPFENATDFRSTHATSSAVKDDLLVPYQRKDYLKYLSNLKGKSFYRQEQLERYFITHDVQLLDSDGVRASGGQAVGFALMMRLEKAKKKPIVLIDEPEASLDNAFIHDDLIKALRDLAKNSMVFVVTHNSTLGTLLQPDYLIITTKTSSDNYSVKTGEFSSHYIADNAKYRENSFDLFVEAMEASIDAYRRKGEVYENLRDGK